MSTSSNCQNFRTGTAIMLAVIAAVFGLVRIVGGEMNLVLPKDFITLPDPQQNAALHQMVNLGLKPYCQGLGLILVLVGVAYLLLGYTDKIETNLTAPTPEDEIN